MSLQKNHIFWILFFMAFLLHSCASSVDQPKENNESNSPQEDLIKQEENNQAYSKFREQLLNINTDSIYEYWSHYPPRLRQNFEYIIVEWNIDGQTNIIKIDTKGNSQYGNNSGTIYPLSGESKIGKSDIKKFMSESGRFRESAQPINHTKIVAKNAIQFFLYDGIGANVVYYSIENTKHLHKDQFKLYQLTLEMKKRFIKN